MDFAVFFEAAHQLIQEMQSSPPSLKYLYYTFEGCIAQCLSIVSVMRSPLESRHLSVARDNVRKLMCPNDNTQPTPFVGAQCATLSWTNVSQVVGPLIHERDVFLAWSLKRSKAVNGCQTVVGVMGKGHLRGVVYALMRDQGELRFRDLAGSRRSKIQRGDVVKRIAFEVAVAGSLALAWVYVPH